VWLSNTHAETAQIACAMVEGILLDCVWSSDNRAVGNLPPFLHGNWDSPIA
jgi:hypothetical protein